jgi:protein-tyrosine phosphatase
MIDLHSHVLPGVDDGPTTLEESLDVLERVNAEGVTAIAATPHVGARYPTAAETMERGVSRTSAALADRGIPLRLLSGGEVELDWLPRLADQDLHRFSLAGSGRYLLVELPWDGWAPDMVALLARVSELGMQPVIAHPERHAEVQERPGRLEALVAGGALLQVTASSLEGLHGRKARKTAEQLLRFGFVHLVASDRHGTQMRRATLEQARRRLGNGSLADWLTIDVPAAVVAGADLPPRPGSGEPGWK